MEVRVLRSGYLGIGLSPHAALVLLFVSRPARWSGKQR